MEIIFSILFANVRYSQDLENDYDKLSRMARFNDYFYKKFNLKELSNGIIITTPKERLIKNPIVMSSEKIYTDEKKKYIGTNASLYTDEKATLSMESANEITRRSMNPKSLSSYSYLGDIEENPSFKKKLHNPKYNPTLLTTNKCRIFVI